MYAQCEKTDQPDAGECILDAGYTTYFVVVTMKPQLPQATNASNVVEYSLEKRCTKKTHCQTSDTKHMAKRNCNTCSCTEASDNSVIGHALYLAERVARLETPIRATTNRYVGLHFTLRS